MFYSTRRSVGEQGAPPGGVVTVPADRVGQALGELDAGGPAQLAADLVVVQRVPVVVALGLVEGLDPVPGQAQLGQDQLGQVAVGQFDAAADVVDVAGTALEQGQGEAVAMVVDVQPVADPGAVARQPGRAAVQQARDEAGDGLGRVLIGTVVVAAPGDHHGQAVGAVVGQGH